MQDDDRLLDYDGTPEFERSRAYGEMMTPRGRVIYRESDGISRLDPHRTTPADADHGQTPVDRILSGRVICGSQRGHDPVLSDIPARPRQLAPEAVGAAGILIGIGAAILAIVLAFV